MAIRPLTAADAPAAAALHAAAMEASWEEPAWRAYIDDPMVVAICADDAEGPLGLLLVRVVAGEGEVLMLAVSAAARRRGIGRALLSDGLAIAAQRSAKTVFLEVAADNTAAFSLYRNAGFVEIGRRSGYYRRRSATTGPGSVDAVCMSVSV